jgi:diguanylate cyclase (GGDEF)-like protein
LTNELAISAADLAASLAGAFERTADPTLVVSREGVVHRANGAATAAFAAGDLTGQCLVEVVCLLSRDLLQAALARAADGEASRAQVFTLPPPQELEAVLAPDGSGNVVVVARQKVLPAELSERMSELNRRYMEKVRELASLTGRLREAAITDPLTNLFNRRAFLDRAEVEWIRARRHGHPLCLVVLDLDSFKTINDRYGHAVGDEVLRHFALLLRMTVRTSDIPARFGGEEFVALLPQADMEGARQLAERVRQRLSGQAVPLSTGGEIRVTCSAGIGSSEGCLTLHEVLVAADRALYEAKNTGRDRVCIAAAPASDAA